MSLPIIGDWTIQNSAGPPATHAGAAGQGRFARALVAASHALQGPEPRNEVRTPPHPVGIPAYAGPAAAGSTLAHASGTPRAGEARQRRVEDRSAEPIPGSLEQSPGVRDGSPGREIGPAGPETVIRPDAMSRRSPSSAHGDDGTRARDPALSLQPAGTDAPQPAAASPAPAPAAPAASWDRVAEVAGADEAIQLSFPPGATPVSQVEISVPAHGGLTLNIHMHGPSHAAVERALEELRRRLASQGLEVRDILLSAPQEALG